MDVLHLFLCYNSPGLHPVQELILPNRTAFWLAVGELSIIGKSKGQGLLMKEKKYRTATRDDLKNPDYAYIRRDLRRILLIALSFIVVMVALTFVLK